MLTQKGVFGLIKSMVGSNDIVAVNMTLVKFTGSWPAGVILSQLLYWKDRTKIPGGWVCKSHGDWHDEVFLSEHQCREARRRLETELQIVEVISKKFDGTPKPHYRIKEDVFVKAFVSFLESRNSRPSEILTDECQNTQGSLDCQEIGGTITETTETYTETYVGNAEPEKIGLETFFEQQKSKKPPGSARPPKKEIQPTNYFKDSQFANLKYTVEFFQGTQFAIVDWEHYLPRISEWSDKKRKKRNEAGWKKTMENWILTDSDEGRLRTINNRLSHAINKPTNAGKQTAQSFEDIEARYS